MVAVLVNDNKDMKKNPAVKFNIFRLIYFYFLYHHMHYENP